MEKFGERVAILETKTKTINNTLTSIDKKFNKVEERIEAIHDKHIYFK